MRSRGKTLRFQIRGSPVNEGERITKYIDELAVDQSRATKELWNQFRDRMRNLARKRLRDAPRSMNETEDDIALIAYNAFLTGISEGRFERLKNREDLWQILAMLINRRATDALRHASSMSQGGRNVHTESVFDCPGGDEGNASPGIGQVRDEHPEYVHDRPRRIAELLEFLDDDQRLCSVAALKMDGCSVAQIASHLRVSKRTVERKLDLIREKWGERGFEVLIFSYACITQGIVEFRCEATRSRTLEGNYP